MEGKVDDEERARDTGSHEYGDGTAQYPFDLSYVRGPADFDARHNMKLYGVFSPQFFEADSAMERLLGGWQISGILNWHSAFPWTPVFNVPAGGIIYPGDGYSSLWPGACLGGAGSSSSNDTFMGTNGNFPGGAYEQVEKVNRRQPANPNPLFGQSQGALAGRVINLQARFSF